RPPPASPTRRSSDLLLNFAEHAVVRERRLQARCVRQEDALIDARRRGGWLLEQSRVRKLELRRLPLPRHAPRRLRVFLASHDLRDRKSTRLNSSHVK